MFFVKIWFYDFRRGISKPREWEVLLYRITLIMLLFTLCAWKNVVFLHITYIYINGNSRRLARYSLLGLIDRLINYRIQIAGPLQNRKGQIFYKLRLWIRGNKEGKNRVTEVYARDSDAACRADSCDWRCSREVVSRWSALFYIFNAQSLHPLWRGRVCVPERTLVIL